MLPGVIVPSGVELAFHAGDTVAISGDSNNAALAVGTSVISSKYMYESPGG